MSAARTMSLAATMSALSTMTHRDDVGIVDTYFTCVDYGMRSMWWIDSCQFCSLWFGSAVARNAVDDVNCVDVGVE